MTVRNENELIATACNTDARTRTVHNAKEHTSTVYHVAEFPAIKVMYNVGEMKIDLNDELMEDSERHNIVQRLNE